jgi:DNA-binding transcriptional ArsR family regulator
MAKRRALQVEFQASLPYQLLSFLTVLSEAPHLEGLDARLYAAHAELPAALRLDIELIFVPLGNRVITARLCAESPELNDFTEFMTWFMETEETAVRAAVDSFLADLRDEDCPSSPSHPADLPNVRDPGGLRAYLLESNAKWAQAARSDEARFEQVIRLLGEPLKLKAKLAIILAQVSEGPASRALEECQPTVERSVAFHRERTYDGTGIEVYEDVTGKSVAKEATKRKLTRASRIIFIPSCHTGAYAATWCPPDDERTMLVAFNARPSGEGRQAGSEIIRALFPPLKALTDETRLQILLLLKDGELYAQQIVDQMDLSQSTISRHLTLMVAGGVLSVRKENGMKFYRINQAATERFLRSLGSFLGKAEPEGSGGAQPEGSAS